MSDAKTIRAAIEAALSNPRPRIDWLKPTECAVIASSEDAADLISRALGDTGLVDSGKEGHEYARQLGQVHHVYALRMGPVHVRISGPYYHPRGLFSNLRALERTIRA